jgi:hypothetical protein
MDSNASDIREDHIAFTSCDPGHSWRKEDLQQSG